MSTLMENKIKRARRKAALVLEIIQGKTTVAKASRAHNLPRSEIELWVEDGKKGMENALRANPQDVREQYEKQLKDLPEDRRPNKGERRQQALLQGLEALLSRHSLSEISVGDIAEAAGLSRSAFYFHFDSKMAVFEMLLAQSLRETGVAMEPFLVPLAQFHPRESIRETLCNLASLWCRHRVVLREAFTAWHTEPSVSNAWHGVMDGLIDVLAERIVQHRKAGIASPGPPARDLVIALVWMGERNFTTMDTPVGLSAEKLVAALTEIWVRTIYGAGAS